MYLITIKQGLENILDAKKIREAVFINEQKFKNEFDDIDNRAYHIVIYYNKKASATGRIYKKNNSDIYVLGRIAVLKEYRNLKIGSLIVKQLEKQAIKQNAKLVELSAQVRAKGFYQKLGYHVISDEYLDEFVPHVLMQKQL